MRNSMMLVVAALLANGAQAGEVVVCMEGFRLIPIQVTRRAQWLADQIFDGVGVKIHWRTCKSSHSKSVQERPIVIELMTGELRPHLVKEFGLNNGHTLAFAFPYEGIHIFILYDRVEKVTERDYTPNVLAHVMVHEITHVLQRANYHSASGIMKAHWTDDDYKAMRMKPLPFTDMDIRLIRTGMASLCAKAP